MVQVNEVVLVELEGGAVQHELTAQVVLAQIAPEATLTVLPAVSLRSHSHKS